MLDKLTLHAQMAVLNKNAEGLDQSINEKTNMVKSMGIQMDALKLELERLNGARHYHNLLVEQVNLMIAEANSPAAAPATVSA